MKETRKSIYVSPSVDIFEIAATCTICNVSASGSEKYNPEDDDTTIDFGE